jgi:hypothetical protein
LMMEVTVAIDEERESNRIEWLFNFGGEPIAGESIRSVKFARQNKKKNDNDNEMSVTEINRQPCAYEAQAISIMLLRPSWNCTSQHLGQVEHPFARSAALQEFILMAWGFIQKTSILRNIVLNLRVTQWVAFARQLCGGSETAPIRKHALVHDPKPGRKDAIHDWRTCGDRSNIWDNQTAIGLIPKLIEIPILSWRLSIQIRVLKWLSVFMEKTESQCWVPRWCLRYTEFVLLFSESMLVFTSWVHRGDRGSDAGLSLELTIRHEPDAWDRFTGQFSDERLLHYAVSDLHQFIENWELQRKNVN